MLIGKTDRLVLNPRRFAGLALLLVCLALLLFSNALRLIRLPLGLSRLTGFLRCQDLIVESCVWSEDSHSRVHKQGVLPLLSDVKGGICRCVVVDNGNLLILITAPVNAAYLALDLKGVSADIELVTFNLCEDDVILGHVDSV